ncbi:Plasma membrane ATPase 1 [Trifolium repens]|nr:Plasma membrane ATPase 1 [Trifolium repens]
MKRGRDEASKEEERVLYVDEESCLIAKDDLPRISLLLVFAFIIAQLVATAISAFANWEIAGIRSIGMGWAGVIWLFNIVTYVFLDPLKFAVAYQQSGRAWNLVVNQRTAFTNKNDFGKESREAAWAAEQRTLHGLRSFESKGFAEKHNNHREINTMADEAKRRAELARAILQ